MAEDGYRTPPQIIVDMLDAPPTPLVSVSPDGRTLLLMDRADMPSIADLAQPMLRLAGYRINPATNGSFTTSYNTGITVKRLSDGMETAIVVPQGARLSGPAWAPNGERFVFTNTTDQGIELWVGHTRTQRVRPLTGAIVNGTGWTSYRWLPDSERVVVRVIPAMRDEAPQLPELPSGPVVEENLGRVAPVRTYQDLLASPHDEALFDHYFTSELQIINTLDGSKKRLGDAAIYSGFDPSPDGRYLMVRQLVRPYSYRVTARSFPETVELWNLESGARSTFATLPLRDTTPIGGVPAGPRSHQWMAKEGTSTLLWVEALDGGDPKREVAHRDRVLSLESPFTGEPTEIIKTEHRYSGITWIERTDDALISEFDRDRRWTRTTRFNPMRPAANTRVVFDRSINDRYGDPGRPVTRTNAGGRQVAVLRNGNIYLSGRGASDEGDRPFLDRMNLLTLVKDRMWQCGEGVYETVIDLLPEPKRFLTSRESPHEPPNYFLRDMGAGSVTQITQFEDPQPQIRGIHKELVTYTRDDGVTLSATLYLPADHTPGTKLPLLVWAYPREFSDARTAGQVSGSPHRFTRLRGTSHLFLLTQGYAIMDGATMPVIGDAESMNDTFIKQIVASAKAAIDFAADRGVADPDRVGVGGHSYGAFMTANLLAHCDLFRAGVARSGAYNRTLTPFGFQSERRTLWEAPMAYFKISPFMHADKINEPILLIHGERDNNSGTFPLQSKRMFGALKGHGATARLVMLPNESHGYRARESVLHVLAEMNDWFETYVKSASDRSFSADTDASGSE
jgi:dipeptidyl aminopeptidase/acylaminoacyl peptidase